MTAVLPLAKLHDVQEHQNPIPLVRELYGSRPWRAVYGDCDMAAILDSQNNTLFECKREIAFHIMRTQADFIRLNKDAADYKLLVYALQSQLRQVERTPRVAEMIRMVDMALESQT